MHRATTATCLSVLLVFALAHGFPFDCPDGLGAGNCTCEALNVCPPGSICVGEIANCSSTACLRLACKNPECDNICALGNCTEELDGFTCECPAGTEFDFISSDCAPISCEYPDACPNNEQCFPLEQICATTPCPQFACCPKGMEYDYINNQGCVAVSCEYPQACPIGETCIPEGRACITSPCPQFRCLANVQQCGGLLGLLCPGGEYCNYDCDGNCGAADELGTCLQKPQVCTQDFQPVTGCDNRTYANACIAASEGVSVKCGAVCGNPADPPCMDGYYCAAACSDNCGNPSGGGRCFRKPDCPVALPLLGPISDCDTTAFSTVCDALFSNAKIPCANLLVNSGAVEQVTAAIFIVVAVTHLGLFF